MIKGGGIIDTAECAEYIDFLSRVTPEGQMEFLDQMKRFNLGPAGEADCPVYDGMFDYFQVYNEPSLLGKTPQAYLSWLIRRNALSKGVFPKIIAKRLTTHSVSCN